ncbi:BON domain-containing protein [Microvirga massiliensis]|uniref:BON domain-containing protein n=1 Tax=Microvirga massiliensis TaxID=1033741 RepID=UPI0007C70D77|nr:BON domain-containing protein [Microvirga massiliensis]
MNQSDWWKGDRERGRYQSEDRTRRERDPAYGRGTDYEGDGTIARRGFGNPSAGFDRGRDMSRGYQGSTNHRGRGPRGYTRSDDRIREDVCERLTSDPWVDASEIEVSVSDREVTLSGMVDSRDAKRRAEDCAESVSGVTHVQNNLRVQNVMAQGMTSGTASDWSSHQSSTRVEVNRTEPSRRSAGSSNP